MEDLLLLIHRIPYPPNKGDKIRSYQLLKHLAQHYRVHLATFVDDPDDWQHVPTVQAMCASSHFGKLQPLAGRVRSLGALVAGRALSFEYYRNGAMQEWVDQSMQANGIQRVLVFSSPMAQYAENYPAARRVVDFCDVDSDKWRQYAEKKPWPMSWLYRREANALLAYERHVAKTCNASLFVSAPEAEQVRLGRRYEQRSIAGLGHMALVGQQRIGFMPIQPAHWPWLLFGVLAPLVGVDIAKVDHAARLRIFFGVLGHG